MGEFGFIDRYLKPLAGEGSEGLLDDAARLSDWVLTKDVLVEGVHFLSSDPLDLVARKALRVNISDLLAKGAKPRAYLLGLVWPRSLKEESFAQFTEGLSVEQEVSELSLLGGDTTSAGEGGLVISVTMFGAPLGDRKILRSGAEPGDLLVVTGTIGAGYLGLEAARRAPPAQDPAALPYRLPQIPAAEAAFIAEHATASLDVSDGLLADAGHLASASEVDLIIDAGAIPLAPGAKTQRSAMDRYVTAGDDYQTLMTVRPAAAALQEAVAQGLSLTIIGQAAAMRGNAGKVEAQWPDGTPLAPKRTGWDHFKSDQS